jgi:anthranilate phosphoribosyltransferase
MAEGLQRAQQALASGAALAKLHELVAYTQKLAA